MEDVPHRHTVFTIPKRLRVFFKYDRSLNEKNPRALEKASDSLPESKIAATATGTFVELPDDRAGFAPHRAYVFSVAPPKGQVCPINIVMQ